MPLPQYKDLAAMISESASKTKGKWHLEPFLHEYFTTTDEDTLYGDHFTTDLTRILKEAFKILGNGAADKNLKLAIKSFGVLVKKNQIATKVQEALTLFKARNDQTFLDNTKHKLMRHLHKNVLQQHMAVSDIQTEWIRSTAAGAPTTTAKPSTPQAPADLEDTSDPPAPIIITHASTTADMVDLEQLFTDAVDQRTVDDPDITITMSSAAGFSLDVKDVEKIYHGVLEIVESTCKSIPQSKRITHPMYYKILDLTGRHQPSKKALGPYFEILRLLMASEHVYDEYKLSPDELKQLQGEETKTIDKQIQLLLLTCDDRGRRRRHQLKEKHHEMHHFYHFVQACEPKDGFISDWGESTTDASARRRNHEHDIQEHAKMGMRVDYRLIAESSMEAELLFGETSGGLPKCSRGKLWYDYLIKLCVASRDSLLSLMADLDHLGRDELDQLRVFSFQLVGFDLYVYLMDHRHGMWRNIMVDSCTLPATNADVANRLETYRCLKTLFKAVEQQMQTILKLSMKRCNQNKRRLPSPEFYSQKKRFGIVPSPDRDDCKYDQA